MPDPAAHPARVASSYHEARRLDEGESPSPQRKRAPVRWRRELRGRGRKLAAGGKVRCPPRFFHTARRSIGDYTQPVAHLQRVASKELGGGEAVFAGGLQFGDAEHP